MKRRFDTVGNVWFKRSTRAKQVNITVKPFSDIVVSVPSGLSLEEARNVFIQHLAWVKKEQEKMRSVEQKYTKFTVNSTYELKEWSIELLESDIGEYKTVKVEDQLYLISVPRGKNQGEIQQPVRCEIDKIMRAWCHFNIHMKVKKHASHFNIPLNKVTFRRSKTRWGSFSDKNNLNLSIYLATLPDHLIDYVIIHELAHYKIKNHSKEYWQHLGQMISKPEKLARELREWAIGMY